MPDKKNLTPTQKYEYKREVNRIISLNPQLERPWERVIGESVGDYMLFCLYKNLGPKRTIEEAYRHYMVEIGKMLPGEPIIRKPKGKEWVEFRDRATEFNWSLRANLWDEDNIAEFQRQEEELRRKTISGIVEQHREGWQQFRVMALRSIYEVDDEGNFILDENNQPKLKMIEDPVAAAKVYRHATIGERTALGIPAEIFEMSDNDLRRRYLALQEQINAISDLHDEKLLASPEIIDMVDAEFTEEDEEESDSDD